MSNEASLDDIQQKIESLKLSGGNTAIKEGLLKRLELLRQAANVPPQKEITTAPLPTAPALQEVVPQALLEKIESLESTIKKQTSILRFQTEPSLRYEKVADLRVRKQLLADNMRMEHALHDVEFFPDFGEELAFRRFCVFAFFQVEEMLTYYYFNKFFHNMNNMRQTFASYNIDAKYLEKAKKVSDLQTFILINAYNYEFFESKGDKKTWGLDNLRNVRNLEEHRCTILIKNEEFEKVENEYSQLKKAREKEGQTEKSFKEIYLAKNYYTLKLIKDRKFEDIRSELNNLYKNTVKQNPT
ncbi:MAG: hypothetical protein M3Y54_05265 [Bacteroidota bacterium]|nr:hypothetical protein [Bacteroidota bacterium]